MSKPATKPTKRATGSGRRLGIFFLRGVITMGGFWRLVRGLAGVRAYLVFFDFLRRENVGRPGHDPDQPGWFLLKMATGPPCFCQGVRVVVSQVRHLANLAGMSHLAPYLMTRAAVPARVFGGIVPGFMVLAIRHGGVLFDCAWAGPAGGVKSCSDISDDVFWPKTAGRLHRQVNAIIIITLFYCGYYRIVDNAIAKNKYLRDEIHECMNV